MRLSFAVFVSVALAVAIVGCGSSPSASSTPGVTLAPGATATPAGATLPPTPAPTAGVTAAPSGGATAPPVGLTGHECDAVPTFSLSNPNPPSFPPDTGLEAHFPTTIDGQPVTDVQSQQWLSFMCYLGGQSALEAAAGEAGGLNFATMSFGEATATVDGDEVKLNAFRTPGADSNTMVQYLALLAAQSGTPINPGDVTSTNVGGKNVFVSTDSEDGSKSYAYPAGDTLIFFENVTDSQAAKILAALP